ncbi:MAG: hypothetical protein CL917_05755 [Deltaproteobacteria bacterium]|nr:hypothetical protein [Deltaproteobacteria bacterium]
MESNWDGSASPFQKERKLAHVTLPRSLSEKVEGELELEVDARNVRALIRALDLRFPGIGEILSGQTAVAIDGEILSEAGIEPLSAQSEVHFLPRVGGG